MRGSTRLRLFTAFHEAAKREPPGTTRRILYKSLAAQLAYGGGLRAVSRTLHRLTSP